MEFKKEIVSFINETNISSLKELDLNKLLEKPKKQGLGDYSLPLFILIKSKKINLDDFKNNELVLLNENKPNFIKKIELVGPFLNFYINYSYFLKDFQKNAEKEFENIKDYFNSKKVLLEYPSPNTNKSLHVGHVRNILIGNSLKNIFLKAGYDVIHTNLNNDRGISICQAMLMYEKFGNNRTPQDEKIKPDKFVQKFYVMFNEKVKENPELKKEALDMLERWENGDPEIRDLWKKFMKWVFEGYKETYKLFKITNFDKEYFESEIYDKGKEIVLDALNKGIPGFKKDETGAIYYDFNDETYGKKYLLRPNGTTLYMTQDIYLAKLKQEDFNADKNIFVVGKEQKYHFEVLFKLLDILNIAKLNQNYHFAYGYVYDKDGNKFSSRKGNVIGADELYEMIYDKAISNLKEKSSDLSEEELNYRASKIAYSALVFSFLKVNPLDDMKFDLEKAVTFEGETGPYIMYTFARINSILRKSELPIEKIKDYKIKNLNSNEENLIKILFEFEEELKIAIEKYKISQIANYLIKLSKSFNEYYQKEKILVKDINEKMYKLKILYLINLILKSGAELLGMDLLEKM